MQDPSEGPGQKVKMLLVHDWERAPKKHAGKRQFWWRCSGTAATPFHSFSKKAPVKLIMGCPFW
jgi:hypothetical protein